MRRDEVAPPGWSGTVTAMRKHHGKEIDNPYALAWSMKNKGDHPHYKQTKDDKTTHGPVPRKKSKYKDEDDDKKEHKVEYTPFSVWLEARVAEHKLTSKEREHIKKKDFALPGGRYPLEDPSHARNALSRVSQFGSSQEKKKVRAAVHRKYPEIGEKNKAYVDPREERIGQIVTSLRYKNSGSWRPK